MEKPIVLRADRMRSASSRPHQQVVKSLVLAFLMRHRAMCESPPVEAATTWRKRAN